MGIDAILIAENGKDGLTGIVPERLNIEGMPCSIQVVNNYVRNKGRIVPPVQGDGEGTWWSAPKLNGLFLLGYLTKKGHDVRLVNKYFPERERFISFLRENPRAVAVSTTFIRSKEMLQELVKDIRSHAPDIFIVAGGSFVYLSYLVWKRSREPGYLSPEAANDHLFMGNNEPEVDLYIISPCGEGVLARVLTQLREKGWVGPLPGTARHSRGIYAFPEREEEIVQGHHNPMEWEELPNEVFSKAVVPVQASKGCPHKCAFCNFVKDRRMLFMKPIDELMREIRIVESRGVRYVWFVDDNFRLGSSDLNQVCRTLVREKIGVRWMTMVRASTLQHVDPELLRESGCIEVQLGLESADEGILKNMNKKASPALYRKVVRLLLAAGIKCSVYFIFGFPGETDATATRTRRFIQSIEYPELEGTLTWSLFPFCLYPMSPIYEKEMRQRYGLTGHLRQWKHKTMDSGQAMEHIRAAFLELNNSSPVYRGDNLSMLLALEPGKRKRFLVNRHRLSKLALRSEIERSEILDAFRGLALDASPGSAQSAIAQKQ